MKYSEEYTKEDKEKFIKDLGGYSYSEFIKELAGAMFLFFGFYALVVLGFCL